MARSVVPELGVLLDALTPTGGGRTQAFTYVPYGRHLDSNYSPATGNGLCTIQQVALPARSGDIGSGVSLLNAQFDLHFWWDDHDDITDPDAWRQAVEDAALAVIRANEKITGNAWYVQPRNSVDLTEWRGEGNGMVIHHLVLSVEAFITEAY